MNPTSTLLPPLAPFQHLSSIRQTPFPWHSQLVSRDRGFLRVHVRPPQPVLATQVHQASAPSKTRMEGPSPASRISPHVNGQALVWIGCTMAKLVGGASGAPCYCSVAPPHVLTWCPALCLFHAWCWVSRLPLRKNKVESGSYSNFCMSLKEGEGRVWRGWSGVSSSVSKPPSSLITPFSLLLLSSYSPS